MLGYSCVLFDLDDTLVRSARLPRRSLTGDGGRHCADSGESAMPEARPADVVRLPPPGLCLSAAGAHLLDPATPRVLAALAEQGVKLGIVTSAPRCAAIPALRAAHLHPVLSGCVVTAESCRRRKPHPDPLRRALAILRAVPEQALYVGDTPEDAVAAHACGMRFALAGWSRVGAERSRLPHDWLLNRVSDLLALAAPHRQLVDS